VDKKEVKVLKLDHTSKNVTTQITYQADVKVAPQTSQPSNPSHPKEVQPQATTPQRDQASSLNKPLSMVKKVMLPKTGTLDQPMIEQAGIWAMIIGLFGVGKLLSLKKQKERKNEKK
jgi:hypothetical protein